MKDKQYKNPIRKLMLLMIICMLFMPAGLFSENQPHEIDIGATFPIDCPSDIVTVNEIGNCGAYVSFTPPANATLIAGQGPDTFFPVGVTTVTYQENGGTATCSFTVTVNDTESPVFTFCPDDIIQSYDAGICQIVEFETPVPSDNCSVVYFEQVSGLSSGSVFPIGNTVIEFVAKDAANNSTSCSFSVTIAGNNTTVLKTDGSNSEVLAPQGELRYQRAFYLLTPDEMASSDLADGMEINSIGFTIGIAQDDVSTGDFKVYLQNTTDEISRIDDDWTTVTIASNSHLLGIATPGVYEWQVKAICSESSDYSVLAGFANDDLDGCNQPFNLEVENITESSATFSWELPELSSFDSFELKYGVSLSSNWTTVSTSDMNYNASGLEADSNYQWTVKSICNGNESTLSSGSFSTDSPDLCDEPTSLAIGVITDTTVEVSWLAVDDSSHYRIAYRRLGTSAWYFAYSLNNSYTFINPDTGTTFEWKVRTACADGSSAYVAGPDFTTLGSPVCYIPEDLKTSAIGGSGVTLSWLEVPGAGSYEIRYRLKESISWANAINGMTPVSDGQLIIPDTIGQYDIPFEPGTPFTYTGNGVYVAWEYSNPTNPTTSANTALCTEQNTSIPGVSGLDSLRFILSFKGNTDVGSTALPATLRATKLRPETRLGSPTLVDSVEVTAVYTLGYVATPYGSPVSISALIKNFDDDSKTIPVSLSIYSSGGNTPLYSVTQDLYVPTSCAELITFPDWISTDHGTDSIVVSVPVQEDENVVDNNSNYYMQKVKDFMHSYADEASAINGAGFGTGDGLILSRFTMNGCGKLNSARVFLHYSAADNPVYAVLLDAAGSILDISDQATLDSTEVNNYHSFYFPNTPLITNNDYYIGLAQIANVSDGYYPVGVQWESNIIREGAYFRAELDGSNIVDHPYPGRLMIKAEIIPAMPVPFISGSDILCAGNTNTLQAASKTIRYADNVNNVSSEFSSSKYGSIQILGSPDVYPAYGQNSNAWISQTADGQREYIELHFPDLAKINYIDIYQTLNAGAIDTVYTIDSVGNNYIVYSDSAQAEPQDASIKEIRFDLTTYRVSEIRIALSSDSISGHHAIDAVGIGIISDPATFSSYSWDPGGETTQSISVNTPGNYILIVSNSASCTLSDTLELTTPTLTIPTISYNGPIEFCMGDSVTLFSSEVGGNTWSTGETMDSITVFESGIYNVTYDNGCETGISSDVIVTVFDLPEVIITGGAICPGESAVLNAGAGYASYLWLKGSDTLANSGETISVNATGEYSVFVTDNNGCDGSGSAVVFYSPSPTPLISGDPNFCPGDSTLLDAGWGYSSYLWSTGETSRQIYVKTSGLISVTVTNEYGCTGMASVTTGEYVPPQPFVSGALTLCFGSATILDAGEGFASYLWSTGEITNAIVVDTAATFSVTVTDAHGCKGSASATTSMDGAIPEIPGEIYGPEGGICQQNGLVYSIDPMFNTTHYVWTVPDGITITGGQGSPEITVDVGIISSGLISVAASNTCGQSPTWNGRYLEVHGSPDIPGEITGPANGVCGLSGLTYSIDEVYGSSSYNWIVPAGATINTGLGTSEITVSFDASFISGKICVSTTNACGESDQACLQVNSKPLMPVEIFGPVEVCRKEKNVAYSIDPVFNADNYIWTVPLQASIKSGQGTPDIVVNFGNKAGFIRVQTENDCGLSPLQSLEVDVVPCDNDGIVINIEDPSNGGSLSDDPVLNGSKHIFFPEVIASAGDFYVGEMITMSWTIGESVIETVKSEDWMLSQGFHQNSYDIIALGGIPEGITFDVEVYPIPTRDNIHIHISSDSDPVNLIVELYDMVGNFVYKENVKTNDFNHTINLYKYPANIFVLKVTDLNNNFERTFKIVKVKL